jgi:hypothetical protein
MKRKIALITFALGMMMAGHFMTGCTKEGPAGKDGKDGIDGVDGAAGQDGTASCIECHSPDGIELAATQYQISKHSYGEAAFAEAGSHTCGVCHLSESFKYVVTNNTPATFTLNTTTGKYVNNYAAAPHAAYGEIGCSTCHNQIHSEYDEGDLALTTVAPVALNMWGGAQTATLPADGGRSHLCVKCHQPRPFTSLIDGNVLDYAGLASNPTAVIFDAATPTTNKVRPGYRTHTHYGTAGAIFAGKGGVEFPGTATYANTAHTNLASCQDCHMAPMQGKAGGHTFFAKGNFNGCNASGCHTGVNASNSNYWTEPRAEIKSLLDELAAALTVGGVEILNRNPDADHNLWAANTSNKYDGYLNIYDPITNPEGVDNNPAVLRNPAPSNSWSAEQKAYNLTLQEVKLTNAQMGALINFQLVLRDYSQGIHNFKYSKALLQNSIEALASN